MYNSNLNLEKKLTLSKKNILDYLGSIDINSNNNKELIFKDSTQLYFVFDDFRDFVTIDFVQKGSSNITVSKSKKRNNLISVQTGNTWYLINVIKDEVFFHSIFFYFIVFVFISLVVFLISRLRTFKLIKTKTNLDKINVEKLEDNLDERIQKLKNELKNIKGELKDESYKKVINKIDTTFNEVKVISKQITNENSASNSFNKRLTNLIENQGYQFISNYALYPNVEWSTIDNQLELNIIEFLQLTLSKFLPIFGEDNRFNLQVINHEDLYQYYF